MSGTNWSRGNGGGSIEQVVYLRDTTAIDDRPSRQLGSTTSNVRFGFKGRAGMNDLAHAWLWFYASSAGSATASVTIEVEAGEDGEDKATYTASEMYVVDMSNADQLSRFDIASALPANVAGVSVGFRVVHNTTGATTQYLHLVLEPT